MFLIEQTDLRFVRLSTVKEVSLEDLQELAKENTFLNK